MSNLTNELNNDILEYYLTQQDPIKYENNLVKTTFEQYVNNDNLIKINNKETIRIMYPIYKRIVSFINNNPISKLETIIAMEYLSNIMQLINKKSNYELLINNNEEIIISKKEPESITYKLEQSKTITSNKLTKAIINNYKKLSIVLPLITKQLERAIKKERTQYLNAYLEQAVITIRKLINNLIVYKTLSNDYELWQDNNQEFFLLRKAEYII